MVVKGLDNILKNLNKEIQGIENRTQGGLTEAGLLIKRRSQLKTPVDTGNLKASAYVYSGSSNRQISTITSQDTSAVKAGDQKKGIGTGGNFRIEATVKGPWAVIGYSANYALYVHEMSRTHMKWDKKKKGYFANGEWKFLESAVKESEKDVINIIKNRAKI